jgi:hypothetical protein
MRAVACAALAAFTLMAASPAPAPVKTPYRIDVTKIQPKALLPKVPLHTEYVVAINRLGQVTKIISGKPSKDATFNMQTSGNALQAFIRTPDDKAIPGTYRLTYDYNPATTRVRRNVSLVHEGGVDVNARGAALLMMDDVQKFAKAHPATAAAAEKADQQQQHIAPLTAASTGKLPDLNTILKTPAP